MYDYFTDVQLSSDIREGVACPPPAIRLILADRWHKFPWEFDDASADQFLYWLNVMSVEAEAHNDREGLASDEASVRMD